VADGSGFSGYRRPAMQLVTQHRAITSTSLARMNTALASGCWCAGECARLVRRTIRSGTQQVTMQCQECGKQIGGPMTSTDHPGRQDYPEWDVELVEQYVDAQQSLREERLEAMQERQRAHEAERAGYLQWCRTSAEWHALSERVMWRSRRTCEACLAQPAVTIHHLTYNFGKLPPAWHLRAVCNACHDRLHADKRGSADEWCVC